MRRLLHVAGFELRQQLGSPVAWVGALIFFLFAFGATTVDQVQIGSRGNVHVNAPIAVLEITAVLSLMSVFVVVAMIASVVIRDDETRFAPLVHATPVGKPAYLIGRYLGAVAAAWLVVASVPAGITLGACMPWVDPEKLGPFQPAAYAMALGGVALPTLLIVSSLLFALAVGTRSLMASYVGALALLSGYVTLRTLLREPAWDPLVAWLDPFGLTTLRVATKYWTAAERNTLLPAIGGVLLGNRLLWAGLGLGTFALAYRRFRFGEPPARRHGRWARRARADEGGERDEQGDQGEQGDRGEARPAVAPALRSRRLAPARAVFWRQTRQLVRLELRLIVQSPAFGVMLAIGALNSLGALMSAGRWYGAPSLPVTRLMVETLQGAFGIMPMLIAIYYAGELVWRDRDRRFHELVDATPAPEAAQLLPKLLAIVLALLASTVVGVLTAMGVQLAHGWTTLEPLHYLLWFVWPNLVTAVLIAVLGVTVQVLVPHKALGWAVMMVFVVGTVTLNNLGWEHNLYQYAGAPPPPLSDMNGLGRFWVAQAAFQAYWACAAVLLALAALALWRRGAITGLRERWAGAGTRLGPVARRLGAAATLGMAGLGGWIWWNTNVLNAYEPEPARDAALASFERRYLHEESLPLPRITEIVVDVQLEPRAARAVTTGHYTLVHRGTVPIDTLLLHLPERLRLERFDLPGARRVADDPAHRVQRWQLSPPMQPGETRRLDFRTVLEERGFPNARPLTRLVENGSFVDSTEILPTLGIQRDGLLKDRAKRRRLGLPPDLRPPTLEDEAARFEGGFRRDADWVQTDIRVSTDADQTPIAPGRLVEDRLEGGRRIVRHVSDAPIVPFFSIQSGRYAVVRDRWGDVDLAVYHHPGHEANVPRMLAAMKATLALCSEQFSPYQFHQARIVEFPAYANFAQSFANTIPYSESLGFIAAPPGDDGFDVVSYVTAHEIAHQWWGHQLNPSAQQGATMLVESLAQYTAMLVVERMYGRERLGRYLKYELDRYLSRRGAEPVEELPLARVEDQPYIHYQKGSLAMNWLKERIGEPVLNRTLSRLLRAHAFRGPPYPNTLDFLALLREEAGPAHDALIADLFERITLLDLRLVAARAHRRDDGRWDLQLDIDARKLVADGQGRETEVPLDEPVEIGLFRRSPEDAGFGPDAVLHLQAHPLHSGAQRLQWVVDERPAVAGIDPLHRRIDRSSDDNLQSVIEGD